MKQHFNDFSNDFLLPDESNFNVLLQKMATLQKNTAKQVKIGVPRMPLKERFTYNPTSPEVQTGKSSAAVLQELAEAFQGSVRIHQTTAAMNVMIPPLLDTVAAASITMLYNPNAIWDYPSGKITAFEKEVVAFLSNLASWDVRNADGVSTFGGKATLLYALRCGLNTCDRSSVTQGLRGGYVVIASKNAHYSLEDCCNYVGIGRDNVLRVAVDETAAMIPQSFEATLKRVLEQGKKVAAIIALGGDTIEHAIDPLQEIHDIRNRIQKKFALPYKPFLHLDSVNGWIGLAFRGYDFSHNPLGIESAPLQKIQQLAVRIGKVHLADSFSADFHKVSLTPYISSFFIAKDGRQLQALNKTDLPDNKASLKYGELHTHHFSFENSRSAAGIVSAWTAMKRLGINGYQRLWAQLMAIKFFMVNEINEHYSKDLRVLNDSALGHPIVLQFLPPSIAATFEEIAKNGALRKLYNEYNFALYEYFAYQLLGKNEPYPLLGFIPAYRFENTGVQVPAFLLYPNQPHATEQDCQNILKLIMQYKRCFDNAWQVRQPHTVLQIKHLPK